MASDTKNREKLRQKKVKTFNLIQSICTVWLFQVSLVIGHLKQFEWLENKQNKARLSQFQHKGPSEKAHF